MNGPDHDQGPEPTPRDGADSLLWLCPIVAILLAAAALGLHAWLRLLGVIA